MKNYIGTKNIKARPLTKQEYCDYRGWAVPPDEDPNEEIYLVEYAVDPESKPNHPDHEGYITMSPKHVFEKAYKPADTYLDRLIIERDNLEDKLAKLTVALAQNKIPEGSVEILEEQQGVMDAYLTILNKRIG